MSKWKEFVERSKREYAEASPEGKRKIIDNISMNINMSLFFLAILLILLYLLVPYRWSKYFIVPILIVGVFLYVCAVVSNHIGSPKYDREKGINIPEEDSFKDKE